MAEGSSSGSRVMEADCVYPAKVCCLRPWNVDGDGCVCAVYFICMCVLLCVCVYACVFSRVAVCACSAVPEFWRGFSHNCVLLSGGICRVSASVSVHACM
mgnify:CR=1 FL=1